MSEDSSEDLHLRKVKALYTARIEHDKIEIIIS